MISLTERTKLEKEAVGVVLYCSNPEGRFTLVFDSIEEARGDIEERIRWYELDEVAYIMPDGSKLAEWDGETE